MPIIQVNTLELIAREDWNIRKHFPLSELNSLKMSIHEIGLQNPITINNKYEIVAGYRRYHACVALGMKSIICNMIEYKTELHERLAHIDENLEARNFNEKELEKALAERKRIYQTIYPKSAKPGQKSEEAPQKSFATETAEKSGIEEWKIRKLTRRVDDVTDEVRIAYEQDKISVSQIDEIVRLDKADQNKILEKIIGTSVAETRLMIDDFLKAKAARGEQQKKNKKDTINRPLAPQVDEKKIDSIMVCEKTIRAIIQAENFVDEIIDKKLLSLLEKDQANKLRTACKRLTNKFEHVYAVIGEKNDAGRNR